LQRRRSKKEKEKTEYHIDTDQGFEAFFPVDRVSVPEFSGRR
jgi:hypothetical protein